MTSVTGIRWLDLLKRGSQALGAWFVPVWWSIVGIQSGYQVWQGTKVDALQLLFACGLVVLLWADNKLTTRRLRQQRDDYRCALEARGMLMSANDPGTLYHLASGDILDCSSQRWPGLHVKIKVHNACTIEVV